MASKRDTQKWIEKTLGKPTADAVLKKVERLTKKGAAAAEIEEAIAADLMKKIKTLVRKGIKYHVPHPGRMYGGHGHRGPHK